MAADMEAAVEDWPEREPYPTAALPETVRAAVAEVIEYVQCPAALAGSAALAVLSTAAQAQVDVVRDHGLGGPTSLYLIAVAESGERKSTVDRLLGKVLRDHEREAIAQAQPALTRGRAARESWEARREGIVAAIRRAAGKHHDCADIEAELAAHMAAEPEIVREPALLHTDATPEALAWALHTGWPSGALMTAEGGLVLGGHAMGRDSIMRHLALLNALWDDVEHRVARRTQPSYLLAGRRLTLWIQVQPAALAQYLTYNGALARGSGWLARCLLCRPTSTQGTRLYRSAPTGWPALEKYHARIEALLCEPHLLVEGRLQPRQLRLHERSRDAWISYHDDVERELGAGGELSTVRDAAAKAADNAARLAALFAVYEGRAEVTADDVERGAALVTWHLAEARRILPRVAATAVLTDADALAAWIRARGTASRREVQRGGPSRLRDGARLDAAIAAAETAGKVRVGPDGNLTVLRVNDGAQ
jgi:putative DNA primase/helicase